MNNSSKQWLGAFDRELAWTVHLINTGAREAMVAKVNGLTRLMQTIGGINANADSLASQFERAAERLNGSMETASNNIGQMHAAAEALDHVNAAFGGNGGPPLDDSVRPAETTQVPAERIQHGPGSVT